MVNELSLAYWLGCVFWTFVGLIVGYLLGLHSREIRQLKERHHGD